MKRELRLGEIWELLSDLEAVYGPEEVRRGFLRLEKEGRCSRASIARLRDRGNFLRQTDRRTFWLLVKTVGSRRFFLSRRDELYQRKIGESRMAINYAIRHPGQRLTARPGEWLPRIGGR